MKRICLITTLLLLALGIGAGTTHPIEPDTLAELGAIDLQVELAANQREWADQIGISLLTVGSGTPLYAWFGHSALIVTYPKGSSVMYDWGIFDSEQEIGRAHV